MSAYVVVVREHPIDYTGSVCHLLDEDGVLVWSRICSDSIWARADAEAEIRRRGGTLEHFVDQTAAGRTWLPMSLAGTFGCPVCGVWVWQKVLHSRACPPQGPFPSADSEALCGRYYPASLPGLRCSKPVGHTEMPLYDWCLFDASHPINRTAASGAS